jgi:type IV pilus assembly protein PilC
MAGINIFEVINIISNETGNKYFKKCLVNIDYMVRQGIQLSSCMSSYNDIFPKFMTSMVRVGEESGTLDEIFERLSEFYKRENVLKCKIMRSLAYPAVVLVVSIIVVQILFIYIIPIFVSTINELGGNVPETTKIILSVSSFISNNVPLIIILTILSVMTVLYLKRNNNVNMFFQELVIKSTFTKAVAQKFIAAKFSSTIGILLNSGIPIIKALDINRNILENAYLVSKIDRCMEDIKSGSTFSESIYSLDIFSRMMCTMIRIGEETGRLNDMLIKTSNMLEEELYNTIEKITSLIEPLLIILLSVFVGFILITLIGPMFNIMDTI